MLGKTFFLLLNAFFLYKSVSSQVCNDVGGLKTFYDPSCANGGAGCNAGGQNNCRFCGFDIFPPCPVVTSPTSPKPTVPTSPRTTTPKTTKSTTPYDPNAPTTEKPPAGNCDCNSANKIEFIDEEDDYSYPNERLIFADNFNKLDLKKWKHDITMSGGGNWEFQLYHNNRTNSYVKDGILYIKPTLTEDRIGADNVKSNYRMDMWGGRPADKCTGNGFYGCERSSFGGNIINPVQSAKLTTAETFSFKYGRVEVKAKLPRGDWLWPAIWLLPELDEYGMWPASGEIDIMESRGNEKYPNEHGGGVDSFGSALHWGPSWSENRYQLTNKVYHHSDYLSEDFHVYGLHWTEDRLFTYIDDESNIVLDVDTSSESFFEFGKFPSSYENPWDGEAPNAPFNRNYYLILNLAVGGTVGYFKDDVAGKPWSNTGTNAMNQFYDAKAQWFPTWNNKDVTFEIDSVKVWSFD